MLNILNLTVNFFFLRYLDKVLQGFRKKVSNFQILQLLWRFRAFFLSYTQPIPKGGNHRKFRKPHPLGK